MRNAKVLSNHRFFECLLFQKKFLVFLVFFCMSVNGFVPGVAVSAKSSFVLHSAVAAYEAVSSLFKTSCRNPLNAITGKVLQKVMKSLFACSSDGDVAAGDTRDVEGEGQNEAHGSSGSACGAITHENPLREYVEVLRECVGQLGFHAFFVKLFILYGNMRIGEAASNFKESCSVLAISGVLLFIVSIVRRKVMASMVFIFKEMKEIKGKTRFNIDSINNAGFFLLLFARNIDCWFEKTML
ncbi:MAG: hypothetical protein LBU55_00895 [Elusimicrobiota bacterium]|jgi:hypothetical protein|nr:hypothetical protein [Elusimicrobiota bacterium]